MQATHESELDDPCTSFVVPQCTDIELPVVVRIGLPAHYSATNALSALRAMCAVA
jgi:hypothetical protein